MDFFGYKVPCDFIGEAGSYSGDPSKDGRLDMVKKQEADDEADKDFEFLNGIDNNLWPLKDLPEDKWERYSVTVVDGKCSIPDGNGGIITLVRQ